MRWDAVANGRAFVDRLPLGGEAARLTGPVCVSCCGLPFYERARAVCVESRSETLVCVTDDGEHPRRCVVLDGSARAIRKANEVFSLRLSSETIIDYARFYCGCLRDETGRPFDIVDAETARIVEADDGAGAGEIFLACRIRYAGWIYRATLGIRPDGQVQMFGNGRSRRAGPPSLR